MSTTLAQAKQETVAEFTRRLVVSAAGHDVAKVLLYGSVLTGATTSMRLDLGPII